MIRMRVVGLQTSHLLSIRTKSGYGTVLMATCARQGCSGSGLVWFWFLVLKECTVRLLTQRGATVSLG
jgi:hypothetical protein